MPRSKTDRAELLAAALARGQSISAWAREVGVSRSTASVLANRPDVRARADELRAAMIEAAVGALADAATEAVATLRLLLNEPTGEATRLGAARAILGHVVDLADHADLSKRVAELKALLDPDGPGTATPRLAARTAGGGR